MRGPPWVGCSPWLAMLQGKNRSNSLGRTMRQLLSVLWQYLRARQREFPTRAALERFQHNALARHLAWVAQHSPYYPEFAGRPLAEWPVADKKACLASFDRMNTAGLRLEETLSFAMVAENNRNFSDTLRGHTVGRPSGTSGPRGLIVANARERALWAGLALRRVLPEGLLRGERIAFFLRANSTFNNSVHTPWLSFRFYELMSSTEIQLKSLEQFNPTIIVAPAHVLRHLSVTCQAGLCLTPKKVISVTEVLEQADREFLQAVFPQIAEAYQTTEGLLGYTCSHGRMHLNEDYLYVEPEWLDGDRTRMVPIITDFSRTTQPVIRYRLNEVLAVAPAPCPCGNPALVLSHSEGAGEESLSLPGRTGVPITVLGEVLSRALLRALPLGADYRLVHTDALSLQLIAPMNLDAPSRLSRLTALLGKLGVDVRRLRLTWLNGQPEFEPGTKRRRIIKQP